MDLEVGASLAPGGRTGGRMSETPYSALLVSGGPTSMAAQPVTFCARVRVGGAAKLVAQPNGHQYYQYLKKRCDFGRQPMFCEQGPEMCDSILPDLGLRKLFILRNPVHQPTQNTPIYSQCEINTFRAEYSNTGVDHAEGGWPKDVHFYDPETTQRHRRKVEREENYVHCVQNTSARMEHYVYQNNAIDMYGIYFNDMPPSTVHDKSSARTVNVFRDPAVFKRPVSSVCWQPDGHKFAATYVDVNFNRLPRAQLDCYIWDLENANQPEVTFTSKWALLDLVFNQRDASILAGAIINGQVGVWDRRVGGGPTLMCDQHLAHRDLTRNVLFINAKTGQEFFSGSADGAVKWWDMRNMSDITDEMIMDHVTYSFDVPSMAKANGVSKLEFEQTIPTRFMVGTENGLVLCGNRKGKTAVEKLPVKIEAHLGPVWSLERNPQFLKNFLTVGDWTARIWSEECKESAVLWTMPHRHRITAGAWSPTRMSLTLFTQYNGVLAIWDWLRRQHEPILTVQLCQEPLMQIAVQETGSIVACGGQNGNVYLVELSHTLSVSDKHDKTLMTMMLDRESKRERILEARLREIRLKFKQDAEGGRGSPAESATEMEATIGDKDLAEATSEYMQLVKKEMLALV